VTNLLTEACNSSCASCFGPSSTQCLSCNSAYLYQSQCLTVCPIGYYGDQTVTSNWTCQPCNSSCLTCYGSTNSNCYSCNPGQTLSGSQCFGNCLTVGTYYNTSNVLSKILSSNPLNLNTALGLCQSCHPTCRSCNGSLINQCITCNTGTYLYNGQCLSTCPYSYYPNTSIISHLIRSQ